MTIKLYPQHYDVDATATCGDCGDTCRAIECGPIRDPSERLSSGDPLPAGECPNCGSLSYVADRKTSVFVIEQLIGNDWEALGTIDSGGPDEHPERFDNHTAARIELADHLDAMAEAFIPYDAEEYRIREIT